MLEVRIGLLWIQQTDAFLTAENRRDKFVAGLIGTHYDMDAQIAVLANGTDTPEHAAELEQFAQVRSSCKAQEIGRAHV